MAVARGAFSKVTGDSKPQKVKNIASENIRTGAVCSGCLLGRARARCLRSWWEGRQFVSGTAVLQLTFTSILLQFASAPLVHSVFPGNGCLGKEEGGGIWDATASAKCGIIDPIIPFKRRKGGFSQRTIFPSWGTASTSEGFPPPAPPVKASLERLRSKGGGMPPPPKNPSPPP